MGQHTCFSRISVLLVVAVLAGCQSEIDYSASGPVPLGRKVMAAQVSHSFSCESGSASICWDADSDWFGYRGRARAVDISGVTLTRRTVQEMADDSSILIIVARRMPWPNRHLALLFSHSTNRLMDLEGTRISDAEAKMLADNKTLRVVRISRSGVSAASISLLKRRFGDNLYFAKP